MVGHLKGNGARGSVVSGLDAPALPRPQGMPELCAPPLSRRRPVVSAFCRCLGAHGGRGAATRVKGPRPGVALLGGARGCRHPGAAGSLVRWSQPPRCEGPVRPVAPSVKGQCSRPPSAEERCRAPPLRGGWLQARAPALHPDAPRHCTPTCRMPHWMLTIQNKWSVNGCCGSLQADDREDPRIAHGIRRR
jgi:hypothetical protein